MSYLFTSESVSEGHPDKVADQISDALIDNFLAFDANSKVACETLVTTGQVVLAGEVKSNTYLDVQAISRKVQIHLCLLFTSLLLIVMPVLNKTPSQQVAERSVLAAAEFLFLVDTEEYGESWEVSSAVLQKMLTQQAWSEKISELRTFLGPIIERVQQNIAYTDDATDVPSGEYVVMTFVSKFELRERVTETITLLLGDDNRWQVVGYFLR